MAIGSLSGIGGGDSGNAGYGGYGVGGGSSNSFRYPLSRGMVEMGNITIDFSSDDVENKCPIPKNRRKFEVHIEADQCYEGGRQSFLYCLIDHTSFILF